MELQHLWSNWDPVLWKAAYKPCLTKLDKQLRHQDLTELSLLSAAPPLILSLHCVDSPPYLRHKSSMLHKRILAQLRLANTDVFNLGFGSSITKFHLKQPCSTCYTGQRDSVVGFDRKNIRCVMDRSTECALKGHLVMYPETGSVCAVVSQIVIR
ncbi:hypothetical protein KQX54_012635 [Cotesia glomerata]|uniref:Uncharacterized protein n=1 Tax=Cotesia glomerata TaxID=32391 RepID=A0AAV7IEI8_COTGL|nr:hypothetical protein KQX54_012635 [Cotesia glomerata]